MLSVANVWKMNGALGCDAQDVPGLRRSLFRASGRTFWMVRVGLRGSEKSESAFAVVGLVRNAALITS